MKNPGAKKIIAVVGMVGAGKSETARVFAEQGFPILRFGKITDDYIKKRGLPLNESSEKLVREGLRKKLGMDAYASLMEPKIREVLKDSNVVILDGLYSWEEYTYLSEKFLNLILLSIFTRPVLRYQRTPKRKFRPLSSKVAKERDRDQVLNLNKGVPIAMADYMIENNGSKRELEQRIKEFMDEVI